jgi:rod shape determining protein RodA
MVFGWLNIFAVNYSPADGSFFQLKHRYTMQALWITLSLIIILFIFVLDSRFFSFVAYPAYGLGLLLLLIVLVIGTAIHSSKSWIVIGPISLQPSEFAKVATLLALAKYLSSYNTKISRNKDVLIALGIIFFPALLIMAQPDFGSTIVYATLLFVLYREGLPGWILLSLALFAILFLATLILSQFVLLIVLGSVAVLTFTLLSKKPLAFFISALITTFFLTLFLLLSHFGLIRSDRFLIAFLTLSGLAFVSFIIGLSIKSRMLLVTILFLLLAVGITYSVDFVFNNVMKEHQRNRVNVMLGLKSDPYGYEYNVRQSKIAIGSGGFSGKGFLKGTQTKFRFVPEQSTDFIFCTVGEEWGFLGSFGLVVVYVSLLLRLIVLAERQRSQFSRTYGYGVMAIFFFHFAVNIGMTIGLFPVIGIPLPFLSYGGSSFLAFTIMLFIFIRLDASRKTYLI